MVYVAVQVEDGSIITPLGTFSKVEEANKTALTRYREMATSSSDYDYCEEHNCFYSWNDRANISVLAQEVI
jgi:hypothetical protein